MIFTSVAKMKKYKWTYYKNGVLQGPLDKLAALFPIVLMHISSIGHGTVSRSPREEQPSSNERS